MINLPFKPEALLMDFDGVMTDNYVNTDCQGIESTRCSKLDSMGLNLLKTHVDIYIAVITSETNKGPSQRCQKLGIECYDSVKDKRAFLVGLSKIKDFDLSKSIYIGNDVPDLQALELVGLPIIVQDAHQSLKNQQFQTTSFPGGMGAVREVADAILATYKLK